MMNRRELLQTAIAATVLPVGILGAKAAKVRPKKFYRVTCHEVSAKLLRKLSWCTKYVDLLPEVGETLEIEYKDSASGKTEKFKVRVIEIEEVDVDKLFLHCRNVLLTYNDTALFEGTDGKL